MLERLQTIAIFHALFSAMRNFSATYPPRLDVARIDSGEHVGKIVLVV